ncbi:polysaccharide deacetylase family protein [Allorhizobium sp. BGMRC 0089]|uniref:polysaccharide deacetylase family protein n=1 Tax=Allorhizobium sonneratiae TaxID=2934936 RepID=UPI0020332F0C|nr:polysaccharide deacetylase family protein [Allorhizobium sonneratiae]MCM2290714.1 polysaccharide deacetylase family protein [Allorhizobium sonneratiae]
MTERQLIERLDAMAAKARTVHFWLRDDDAVEPGPVLDRLLTLTGEYSVPLTLAVIPEPTGQALVNRVAGESYVDIAVHGWQHKNHAGPAEKKQELGLHRGPDRVLDEMRAGLVTLQDLYGPKLLPMLVPPWNRIDKSLLPQLPALGYRALSVFGREKPVEGLRLLNTHVDVMDWHGTRGGRDADVLFGEIAACLAEDEEPLAAIGILTHHLVHDAAVWAFLQRLFALTLAHPACRWVSARDILTLP